MTKLLFGKKNMNESLPLTTVLLDKCLQSDNLGSPFIWFISNCKISFISHFQPGKVI